MPSSLSAEFDDLVRCHNALTTVGIESGLLFFCTALLLIFHKQIPNSRFVH